MITTNRPAEILETANPFYLLCDGVPLPVAVKAGNSEALAFRDEWEVSASRETKHFCGYHPVLRNWVGEYEDGTEAVAAAQAAWGAL